MSAATHTKAPAIPAPRPSLRGRIRLALSGLLAGILGVAPHVLHHIGPLAGVALFAGVWGSLLFGAVGFVAAIPFVLRLRRRSGGWRLPAAALVGFAVIFSISTFVIGPAISGGDSTSVPDGPGDPAERSPQPPSGTDHEGHH